MTLETAKQLKVGDRMRRGSNGFVRIVQQVVARGVVVSLLNGSHKELFEWSWLTHKLDDRGELHRI